MGEIPFDPQVPNTYRHNGRVVRASPRSIPGGHWDWSHCFQPFRWFFCPCVMVKDHACAHTGFGANGCLWFHDICVLDVRIILSMMSHVLC